MCLQQQKHVMDRRARPDAGDAAARDAAALIRHLRAKASATFSTHSAVTWSSVIM